MIQLKNEEQIQIMREAGRITGEALLAAREHVRPGVSTAEIDRAVCRSIERAGARPSFLGYGGFPAGSCVSLNDEIIHGIPSPRRFLEEGDIVKIDVGACYRGFHGDSARTLPVGRVSEEAARLIEVTRESFFRGLARLRVGGRLGDVGSAIDAYVRDFGYSTVKVYVGHGVGRDLHEAPNVPNYGTPGHGVRLCAGMTLAIEPMVNAGTAEIIEMEDGWTIRTADGRLSAHYENSVALTSEGVVNLTLVDPDF